MSQAMMQSAASSSQNKIDFFSFWYQTGQAPYPLSILLCICIPLKLFSGQLQFKIRDFHDTPIFMNNLGFKQVAVLNMMLY